LSFKYIQRYKFFYLKTNYCKNKTKNIFKFYLNKVPQISLQQKAFYPVWLIIELK